MLESKGGDRLGQAARGASGQGLGGDDTANFHYPVVIISWVFHTFWKTSTKENLALEASDRPETRLEILTRISCIRIFSTFSSRVEVSKVPN